MKSYSARLDEQIRQKRTPALVGLDPRWSLIPDTIRNGKSANFAGRAEAYREFCCELIDVVSPLVPAVKPQVAFFEQLGPDGIHALQAIMTYARKSGLIVIADAKRGDIGSTATAYAEAWIAGDDPNSAAFPSDALTINPYLGSDTLTPFVQTAVAHGAGVYVLVRTSNPGAGVFQDGRLDDGRQLFEKVADEVESLNKQHRGSDQYGPVGAVVGATWPHELKDLRHRMPCTPLLVPGYGSQGGTAADVAHAFDENGTGGLINSSRGINFAWHQPRFAQEFSPDQWRQAVEAATHAMISDLATHTPAAALRSH